MDMAEKDDTEGRCPACRSPYDKEKIVGMAANCERLFCEPYFISGIVSEALFLSLPYSICMNLVV